MTDTLTLWRDARIATMTPGSAWGLIERGAMLVGDGRLQWIGPESALPATLAAQAVHVHALGGALVTPGLIDCHTHLVYGGQRAAEFEQRLEGASYDQIARAGGGIVSTVAATRAADEGHLFTLAQRRARALMTEGVTTLEIKSGYGLDAHTEARCLRVARRLGRELPLTVRCTSLAAHALPAEFSGRPDDYIDAAAQLHDLLAITLAAIDRQHLGAQVASVTLHGFGDLQGQLTGGCEHQGLRGLARLIIVENRQGEGGGFAGAGLGLADDVDAGEHERNHARLNRRWRRVAELGQRF